MHPLYKILGNGAVKRGPFATLWRAWDDVLDREVALKELSNWTARPARARACFQFAHLRRLALDHPCLAPVHGLDCERGWVVLDYYAEGSLADRLGPLPPERVHQVLVAVLQALAFLHRQGLVHGAVKPRNLFVTEHGQVVLADGLGLRLDSEGRLPHGRALFADLEPEQAKYLAPECLASDAEPLGPALDLYALGLTALELLLGPVWFTALFPRVQVAAQRWDEWQLSAEALPSLRELLPEAPADLVAVVDGLLRKAPGERLDAAAALAILCPPQPPPDVPGLRKARQGVFSRRRAELARLMAACLAGLALGLLLGFLSGRGSGQEPAAALEQELETAQVELTAARAELARVRAGAGAGQTELARARADAQQGRAELARARVDAQHARAELARLSAGAREGHTDLVRARTEVQGQRARADRLAGELKAAQADLARVRAEIKDARSNLSRLGKELTRARTETKGQRARADRLAGELKAAQAGLARARAEAEEHKTRLARLAPRPLPWVQSPGQDHAAEDRSSRLIIATLKELGGKVEVDTSRRDRPVLKVDLAGSSVSDDNLPLLGDLTSLQSLSLSSTSISDAGLAHLRGLTNLQTLDLYSTRVDNSGLAHLRGLARLQTLYLSSTVVGDPGVVHLKGLTNLRLLSLANTRISDTGLAHLKGLAGLQTLDLSTTSVTDAGLAHLQGLPGLRNLSLNYTKVGDLALANLRGLTNLRALNLSYTQVSDAGLAHLRGLSNLRELDLTRSRVSGSGIAELRQALPQCVIRY
jgi:hypothetical protein